MHISQPVFNLIWWCLFGISAGLVARFLVPGRNPLGCFTTLAMGIAGSVLGGLVGSYLFPERKSGAEPVGILLSLCGAVLIILLYRKLHGPTRRRGPRSED